MHLIPRELDKLTISQCGVLAQRRLARGVRLNHAEATALISSVLHELIRDGHYTVADLMSIGRNILGRRHVLPSTWFTLRQLQVEGTFPTGTFLVTVHSPISTEKGHMERALYGSCIPVPDDEACDALFPPWNDDVYEDKKAPGYIWCKEQDGDIILNEGRQRKSLQAKNCGDRPIQIGSHYHFIELNQKLCFNRMEAYGYRLDIPAGTAIRIEPGQCRQVNLVEIGGDKRIAGGNGIATGVIGETDLEEIENNLRSASSLPFCDTKEPCLELAEKEGMTRDRYVEMYGPTKGDVVRLGLTNLWVMVEEDCRDVRQKNEDGSESGRTYYGDECNFGGGKTIRDGMGQTSHGSSLGKSKATEKKLPRYECADTVITNALIIDHTGIIKADIGIKGGKITGIGRAGNPDIMDDIDEGIIIGANTDVIAGENNIVTAGGIDTHVHFLDPAQVPEALCNGLTTLVGGGTGPSTGSNATTCTPGPENIKRMMEAFDSLPINVGITGKGNNSTREGLDEQIEAGAIGLKIHEDWGATHTAIDACLNVCDDHDVQCTIHTDTMNEHGFVDRTLESIDGRTIHTYHTEGAGGGHAPDIIRVVQEPHVLPASTNPTRPYTLNTVDEHLDMVMVAHHLSKEIPADVAFAESRIRAETIAAEDYLHDVGAISIMSSDSQAMGRIGEVVLRTWHTAHKMAGIEGQLSSDKCYQEEQKSWYTGPDIHNDRVKRYIAKYTINPAVAHGMGHLIGSVEKHKLADLVFWKPSNFGTKPFLVLKSGMIVTSLGGDPNGSIPTIEPKIMRTQFGTYVPRTSVMFVSKRSLPTVKGYNLKKTIEPVVHCREVPIGTDGKETEQLGKKHMALNTYTPVMKVDPETFVVKADDHVCDVPPATSLPLTQDYFVY